MATGPRLDRASAVPLYYQLQELIRQQIESGAWQPGDPLPSEPELCRLHGVSRVCVRQALQILEADRAIVRVRGRGTFVAPARQASGVRGLARTLLDPGANPPTVRVLDRRAGDVELSVARVLGAAPDEILRLTTLWSVGPTPIGIGLSFFRVADVPWLDEAAVDGEDLAVADPPALVIEEADISVETTACGRYEANLLGIPDGATLMVTVSVHEADMPDGRRPLEVMRLGYPGDRVQLRFRGTPVVGPAPYAWGVRAGGVTTRPINHAGGDQRRRTHHEETAWRSPAAASRP
ncbi:GntR family transcriptional regulator [Svornostia abyssi]|uniref:GntR family transcriptional regulator n=1 Tax=Svornostia abyssi TaxID=2898438 RepID=A0ABY5PIQ4_9ACTN|nr:GntR family transcriptional regulator [Parviterribacteraceae bacterium J379]